MSRKGSFSFDLSSIFNSDRCKYKPNCRKKHYYIVSKYNQEIPQSQTADNPMAPRGGAKQQSRDTRILRSSRSLLMYEKSVIWLNCMVSVKGAC